MAGSRSRDGTARRIRGGLLATTALTAAILLHTEPTRAQPAAGARPQGGQVVAGSASISTTPSTTTIDQTTQRAAINWNSFNVGSQQTVTFEQPSASSMTLNRVTGPDPSAIAGHIDANGGIVITNPDGVVFYRGSEVNATDLVVSAPGITNKNFMAGHMAFNRPAKPGAVIVNRGNLTIRQAGLGALVAPEVRNRGTITAKLGHVALAGADAATLDMYGDGLVSIDVTRQVARAPDGHEALVTNTGVIEASGGTVQLTAAAADNVVTNLVAARGRIGANSVGNHLGTVAIAGTGGALLVDGSVFAGGAQGGAIEVAGPGDVTVGSHARVSASGTNGGGVVAVGTNLARARGGPSVTPTVVARQVTIAQGARISANARRQGNGGSVTLLSTDVTAQNGHITARGGTLSGDGGMVEISSQGNVGLGGSVDVGASHGSLGSILLDPGTLMVTAGTLSSGSADGTFVASGGSLDVLNGGTTDSVTVSNGAIEGLSGNITLEAALEIDVNATITLTKPGQSLNILSGGDLNSNAAITTNGDITLRAGLNLAGLSSGRGDLSLNAPVSTTGGSVNLSGCCASLTNAPVTASGTIALGGSFGGITTFFGSPLRAGGGLSVIAIDGGSVFLGDSATSTGGPVLIQATNNVTTSASISARGDIDIEANSAAAGTPSGTGVLALGAPVSTSAGSVNLGGATVLLGIVSDGPSPVTAQGGTISVTAGAGGVTQILGSTLLASGNIGITTHDPTGANGDSVFLNEAVTSVNGSVIVSSNTVFVGGPITAHNSISINGGANGVTTGIGTNGFGGTTGGRHGVLHASGDIFITTAGPLILAEPVTTTGGSVRLSGSLVALGTILPDDGVPFPSPSPITASGSIAVNGGIGGVSQLAGSTLQAGGSITIITPGPVTTNDLIASTGSGVTISGSTIGDGGVISANGNISLAGSGGVTIGPAVTSAAGNISITSSGFVDIMDPVTAGPGYEILVAAPLVDIFSQLTVPGNLPQRQLGGPVNVLVQANTLTIGTLAGTFASNGSIVAPGGIVAFTPYTTGYPLTVDDSGLVSIGPVLTTNELGRVQTIGIVGGTPVTGSLYLGGVGSGMPAVAGTTTLNVSTDISGIASTLGLFATGLVTETGDSIITAGTLVGGANSAALTNGNSIGNLSSFTSSSGFSLRDTVPLAIIGPVTDPTSISLTDNRGAITEMMGGGGSLTTGLLTGSSSSSAQFVNTNAVTTLGSFAAPGGFALTNTGPLTVSGPVTGGPAATINNAGAVTLTGPVTATLVGLTAAGSPLTETGAGLISATTLSGTAGSANLGNANTVGTLGSFTTTSGFLLDDTTGLAIAGTVSDPTSVTLLVAGPLTESSGLISAGTLSGRATTTSLDNANTVSALGTFTTTTGFLLNDTTGLAITGAVTDPTSVTITDTGALTETTGFINTGTLAGSASTTTLGNANTIGALGSFTSVNGFLLNDTTGLTIAGTLSDPTAGVTLTTAGALTETTGFINAGTLAGSATTASLGNANTLGTLGNFTVSSGSFVLVDSEPLTVTGPLTAPYFQVVAPGQITLAGATITTTGAPLAAQRGGRPAASGSGFQVTPVGGSGDFVQTGVATIEGLDGTTATVRVDIPAAGNITLADLEAPGADIVLSSAGGDFTGNLATRNLLVIGTTGSSNLFGTVLGNSGSVAAAAAQIEPAINTAYLLNNCVIASSVCSAPTPPVVPPPTPPVVPPLTGPVVTPPTGLGKISNLVPTSTLLLPSLSIQDLSQTMSNTEPPTLQPNDSARNNAQLYIAFPPTLPGESNPGIVLPNVSSHDY